MSFYGNISNSGKTNLVFDRIYPNKKTMDEKAATDEVFIGRFVLIEYDDNTFPHRLGYLKPGEDTVFGGYKLYQDINCQSPYYLAADTEKGYGLKEGDLVFTESNGVYTYYRANGQTDEESHMALFSYVDMATDTLTDYTINYQTDKNKYPIDFVDGWNGTIWQKGIVKGEECYQMVASLDSKVPHFDIVAEAPAAEPIAPHFDQRSTNINYTLHMPTNYGFRIKDAEDSELSDETYKGMVENAEGQLEEKVKYYDIYYNKKALNPENKLERICAEDDNYITFAATGSSGKNYVVHEEGQELVKTENDIQELSIHLPSLGNIATEFWDLLYGDKNEDGTFKEVRNDNINWDSNIGVRFITKDESTGSYEYLPRKVETIAGVINSTQDLMGRIVKYQTSLEDADLDHIYYRALQEEGEENFRPGFFMKTPSTELISFEELNEKYELAFADYKEYIAGKNPQYLTQYVPNYYYIATGSGVEGKLNYLCEIGEKPTSDANYYTLHDPAPELINLIEWNPTPLDKYDEVEPEEIIAYYYREKDEGLDAIGRECYLYIKDNSEFPDKEKSYYSITATKINSLNFYNPEEYSEEVKDEEGNIVYEPIIKDGEVVGERIKYRHKITKTDENNKEYYSGYFYYDDKNDKLIPVYTKNYTPFDDKEQYYLLNDYYFELSTNDQGETVNTYYLNGEKLIAKDLVDNILYIVNFIDFDTQELYKLNEDETIYQRVKSVDEVKENGSYYTLIITLLNGYLEVKKEEDNEGEEEEETPEEPELIYTNFYIPETYYFKTITADFLLDRNNKMQKDAEYYFIDPQPIKVVFYEPNKYYYYSKTREAEGKEPDRLDDSFTMRTAEDPDVVIQKAEGKEDFIYYLKRKAYVVHDDSNHLNTGMVWNVNSNKIPEGVILGALFNDIVEELKAKGYEEEKKYEWKELKGFSQDLNTINGLILQLNKTYRFDDELTRDINTVQGMFNTLRDNFAKFDTLTPGYLLAVNEYGQLDNQNPGELTLAGYEVEKEAKAIEPTDTINDAFGKLEYKVNVLNAGASVEGSVAYQIAEIVEVDGGAIDKLKEIAAWIIDDEAGAAKIIADVATNAGDIIINTSNIEANAEAIIESNKAIAALEDLVGSKAVAVQIAEAIAAENLDKYALASELEDLAKRVSDLEGLVDKTKSDAWNENLNRTSNLESLIDENKAQAWNENLEKVSNLESLIDAEKEQNWNENLDRTSDLELLIDEDKAQAWNDNLNVVSELQTLIDVDKANAWNAALDTIASLLEKVQELEERLEILENPIESEPDPEEPTPEPEPEPEEPTPEPENPEEEII